METALKEVAADRDHLSQSLWKKSVITRLDRVIQGDLLSERGNSIFHR